MTITIASPLTLPCGLTLPNRLAKAALTEGLSDGYNRATEAHQRLYRRWSEGGAGLVITGNVQVDRRYLERPGNIAIDGNGGEKELADMARAGTVAGNQLWMQLSHAGRQTMRYLNAEPVGPSAVPVKLPGGAFGKPRALTQSDIDDVITRFVNAAGVAQDTGFTGIQLHSAHGYLLSEFLSPLSNLRTDQWGGSLENRARLLLTLVKLIRARVGQAFPICVKLNSADFQKGGFPTKILYKLRNGCMKPALIFWKFQAVLMSNCPFLEQEPTAIVFPRLKVRWSERPTFSIMQSVCVRRAGFRLWSRVASVVWQA